MTSRSTANQSRWDTFWKCVAWVLDFERHRERFHANFGSSFVVAELSGVERGPLVANRLKADGWEVDDSMLDRGRLTIVKRVPYAPLQGAAVNDAGRAISTAVLSVGASVTRVAVTTPSVYPALPVCEVDYPAIADSSDPADLRRARRRIDHGSLAVLRIGAPSVSHASHAQIPYRPRYSFAAQLRGDAGPSESEVRFARAFTMSGGVAALVFLLSSTALVARPELAGYVPNQPFVGLLAMIVSFVLAAVVVGRFLPRLNTQLTVLALFFGISALVLLAAALATPVSEDPKAAAVSLLVGAAFTVLAWPFSKMRASRALKIVRIALALLLPTVALPLSTWLVGRFFASGMGVDSLAASVNLFSFVSASWQVGLAFLGVAVSLGVIALALWTFASRVGALALILFAIVLLMVGTFATLAVAYRAGVAAAHGEVGSEWRGTTDLVCATPVPAGGPVRPDRVYRLVQLSDGMVALLPATPVKSPQVLVQPFSSLRITFLGEETTACPSP